MIALPIAAKVAGGFFARNWQLIAGVALAAALGLLLYGLKARGDRFERQLLQERITLERERAEWAEERAKAAALAAAEARRRRQSEQEAQEHEQRILAAAAKREAELVAERNASDRARGVLDAAVSDYARAGFQRAPTADSIRDLAVRAQTLGLLVTERNRMAAEAEQEADRCGSAYRTCRDHAEVVEALRQRERKAEQ